MFKHAVILALATLSMLIDGAPIKSRRDDSGETHSGRMTFYEAGLGACGFTNNDGDDIAAVSSEFFHQFGPQTNGNPICGRNITITSETQSKFKVLVVDICPSCGKDDLDLSRAAFQKLADLSVGVRYNTKWTLDPV